MRENGCFSGIRLLQLTLFMAAGTALGCAGTADERATAQRPVEPVLSVFELPGESRPAVDGDIYLPEVNPADLPQLELTPLEPPGECPAMEIRLQDIRTCIECWSTW